MMYGIHTMVLRVYLRKKKLDYNGINNGSEKRRRIVGVEKIVEGVEQMISNSIQDCSSWNWEVSKSRWMSRLYVQ